MAIIIKHIEIKEVEFNPAYPSFYIDAAGLNYIGFYSDTKAVKIFIGYGLYQIALTDDPNTFYKIQDYLTGGEISEGCFNEVLAKAMFMISGVEVVPTLALQS